MKVIEMSILIIYTECMKPFWGSVLIFSIHSIFPRFEVDINERGSQNGYFFKIKPFENWIPSLELTTRVYA